MEKDPSLPAKKAHPKRNAEDLELVKQAQDGDNAAFSKLVEAYQRRVYALAYGILRNRDDAWDVAQEAFVKAYRNLASFRGQSAFYTWLYRIAYNLSMDTLRSRGRREMVDLEPRHLERHLAEKDPEMDHPSRALDRRELVEVLRKAMNELSDKHRAIIVLREIEGLSYEEMADVLKISKGTVMSRLFHARKNLQKLLQPYVDEESASQTAVEDGMAALRVAPQGV